MGLRILDYTYIAFTIAFTIYGQLILKWRISQYPEMPSEAFMKVKYILSFLLDPLILSGFISAFLASLAWMAAMTKFDLSHAYPFMSLNFVVVLLLSALLLNEPMNSQKIIGVLLIVIGTIVAAKG